MTDFLKPIPLLPTTTGTVSNSGGMLITVKQSGYYLKSFDVVPAVTSTVGILRDGSKVFLISGSMVDKKCTFSSPVSLTSGANYYIHHWNNGSNYTRTYTSGASYPYTADSIITWVSGTDESSGTQGTGETFSISGCTLTDSSGVPDFKINIGDTWKTGSAIKINIGDAWKDVTGMQINIGDSWKTNF